MIPIHVPKSQVLGKLPGSNNTGQVRDDVGFILIVHLYNFIEQFYFLRCLNAIHIWLPNNLGNGGKPILKRFFKQTTRSASRVAQI